METIFQASLWPLVRHPPPPPRAFLAAETPSHQLPLRLTGDSQHFKWGGGVLYPTGPQQDTDHMHWQLTQQTEHPMADTGWLHYHPGMLPYRERFRFTKEGTTQTSGRIAQNGSKAGQIAGGELRRMEGYLGKIPCIKESLYPHEKIILPPL